MTSPRYGGYIEVTVAAALGVSGDDASEGWDGAIAHGEMADVTLAFWFKLPRMPHELSEDEVKGSVSSSLTRVAAAIEAMLLANGAMHLGQIDEPMTRVGTPYGTRQSEPVHVTLVPTPEARA